MALLDAIPKRRRIAGSSGRLAAYPGRPLRRIMGGAEGALDPQTISTEQSNTSIVYGDRLILKLFRRLEEGLNPDLEIGRFLTERVGFPNIPPVAGSIEFQRTGEPVTLGILQGFVPNEGDAWKYTQDALEDFVDAAMAHPLGAPPVPER